MLYPSPLASVHPWYRKQKELEVQRVMGRWGSQWTQGLKAHLAACWPEIGAFLSHLETTTSPKVPLSSLTLLHLVQAHPVSTDLITFSQSCTICSFKPASSFKTCELLMQQDNYLSLLLAYIHSFLFFLLYSASLRRSPFLTKSYLSNQRHNGQGA